MMHEILTGQVFGRLTVTGCAYRKNGKYYWDCVCSCGGSVAKPKSGSDLKSGKVRSCGCVRDETFANNRRKTHGMSRTRLFNIWSSMKQRCCYTGAISYNRYGARGICVCDEWRDNFDAFLEWAIQNGYKDDLTIERIDNNGNYTPQNCKWATYKEQNNNRSNNRIVVYQGKKYTATELSVRIGLSVPALLWRLDNGWDETDIAMAANFANKHIRRRHDNE